MEHLLRCPEGYISTKAKLPNGVVKLVRIFRPHGQLRGYTLADDVLVTVLVATPGFEPIPTESYPYDISKLRVYVYGAERTKKMLNETEQPSPYVRPLPKVQTRVKAPEKSCVFCKFTGWISSFRPKEKTK